VCPVRDRNDPVSGQTAGRTRRPADLSHQRLRLDHDLGRRTTPWLGWSSTSGCPD